MNRSLPASYVPRRARVVLVSTLFWAVAASATPPRAVITVRGRVTDPASRRPIASAVVSLSGAPDVRTNGRGEFTVVSSVSRDRTIAIRRSGYRELLFPIPDTAASVFRFDAELLPDPMLTTLPNAAEFPALPWLYLIESRDSVRARLELTPAASDSLRGHVHATELQRNADATYGSSAMGGALVIALGSPMSQPDRPLVNPPITVPTVVLPAPSSSPRDADSLTLETMGCLGWCPVYRIVVSSGGLIRYRSKAPRDTATARVKAPLGALGTLVGIAESIGFFTLPPRLAGDPVLCPDFVTDANAYVTTVYTSAGELHVQDDRGCNNWKDTVAMKRIALLRAFEALVDSTLGSSRWSCPAVFSPSDFSVGSDSALYQFLIGPDSTRRINTAIVWRGQARGRPLAVDTAARSRAIVERRTASTPPRVASSGMISGSFETPGSMVSVLGQSFQRPARDSALVIMVDHGDYRGGVQAIAGTTYVPAFPAPLLQGAASPTARCFANPLESVGALLQRSPEVRAFVR